MFGSILGFQIAIFLSILAVRVLARGKLELLCLGWTIFTFVMVFASPLILLQLFVIWGSYGLLSGGGDQSRTGNVTRPGAHLPSVAGTAPVLDRVNLQGNGTPQATRPLRGPAPAEGHLDNLAAGAEHFRRKSEELLDAVQVKVAIQERVSAVVRTTYPEQAVLQAGLKRAGEEDRIDRTYDTPERRARFDKALADITSAMEQTKAEPALRVPSTPPDFRFPPRHTDMRVADGAEAGILEAKAKHARFLVDVCSQLRENANLARHFWKALDKLDEPAIAQGFARYAKSQGIDGPPAVHSPRESPETAQKSVLADIMPTPVRQNPFRGAIAAALAENKRLQLSPVSPFEQEAEMIRAICGLQGIASLYHFTRVENLPSIFQHGLRPVQALQASRIPFRWNDEYRIDGHENAICVSISHPNEKLFYRWRMNNPAQRWAVLPLDPAILWESEVAFCAHNAADRRISRRDRKSLGSAKAFSSLFLNGDAPPTRAELGLASYDPTDVQAEVLVFEDIPSSAITGVVFSDPASLTQWQSVVGERDAIVHADRTGLFGLRSVARKTGGN
nr:DarT ssDNA thymidine ADP-ribosyltransferase family protein [uncultured Novosphingobium sp.]